MFLKLNRAKLNKKSKSILARENTSYNQRQEVMAHFSTINLKKMKQQLKTFERKGL